MAKYLKQADAVFLRMDGPRTPMHVGCLLTFRLPDDAPPNFMQQLLKALRSQDLQPPFSCRLARPRLAKLAPAWVSAGDLDFDYHVRHSALPRPGGQRELGILIARLHSHPMDMARPLWEVHLIEGLEDRRFAVYTKAHHALADGATAIRMMKDWLTEDPADRSLDRAFFGVRTKKPRSGDAAPRPGFGQAAGAQLRAARELGKALMGLNDRKRHPQGGLFSASETPRSLFNVPVTAHRRLATQVYEFARFKALSEITGTSINDIVLTITGGAMRRYLQELQALPEKSLIAAVPVALPRVEGRGNAVAGFVVPLATDDADPLRRLERIRTVTGETKEELGKLSAPALDQFAMMGMLPMVLGQITGLNARMRPLCNITVSNVPGPKQPLYLGGAELESIFPVSLLFDGYAINLTLVSYAERYCVGFIGCRTALPHLQRLAVYTGEALEELEGLVLPKPARKPARRRARKPTP